LYPDFIADLERESGCAIDYQRNGAIEIGATEADWLALRERAQNQKALGIPSVPAERENALFYPEDAVVDPRAVTRALIVACRVRRVRVEETLPATGMYAVGGSVKIDTPTGPLTAAAAVLAAGAWSGAIPFSIEGTWRRLPGSFPVRGH